MNTIETTDYAVLEIDNSSFNSEKINQIDSAINNLLNQKIKKIFFDFSRVNSINNDFFHNMKKIYNKFSNMGKFDLFNLSPDVHMMVYIMGIDKYYQVYNSRYDAINQHNPLVKRRFEVI